MKLPRAVKRQDLYYVAVLLVATMLIWCAAYNRWTAEAWRTPTTYGGDAWWGMAVAKAIATGEVLPVLPKQPESLGAPFVANWNDYPSVEEGLNAWWGLLARSFRILVGSNIALLAAHLFAALTFYLVCRRLRYERSFSAAGALLFAFSPYALWRGLPHLGLTYCWHLPLGILVVWWCLAKAPLMRSRRKLGLSIAVAVVFGMQNPYYTGILLQFLFLASLCQLVRRASWRQVLAPIVVVGSFAVVTFLLMNVDTFFWRSTGAASGGAVARSYQHLEVYALKPIELIVPKQHRLETLARWTEEHYFTKAALLGEAGAAYLGVVALGAFAWLVWVAFERLAKRTAAPVPSHLLFIVWVCAYSVVGGINGIVGFALELFRGTNRYSIVILLLLLLFLVRELSRLARR
ncbi:MAG TPA: hypothetical protein VK993_13365, partial [Chthoniobacterales bacterium]|nr:hypothetical protein [Chthoniobacterales bacterium]